MTFGGSHRSPTARGWEPLFVAGTVVPEGRVMGDLYIS